MTVYLLAVVEFAYLDLMLGVVILCCVDDLFVTLFVGGVGYQFRMVCRCDANLFWMYAGCYCLLWVSGGYVG